MQDIFLTLGSVFFAFEIFHHIWNLLALRDMKQLVKEHDEYCEDCEQELIKEIRKKK